MMSRVFLVFVLFLSFAVQGSDSVSTLQEMFDVRVLLAQTDNHKLEWTLESKDGFFVTDSEDPELRVSTQSRKLLLSVKNGRLAINGNRLAFENVEIAAKSGHLHFNGHIYDGSFLFTRAGDMIYLINSIDLEEYLFSVLRWESWPGWPLEVNRAFAVMCRTYVVNRVLQERKKSRPFDIKSTNIHQTYRGTHKFTNLRQALHDTYGMILTYQDQPIVAMYDSCCGGIIPARMDGVDFEKAPYLARDYACTYCKQSKLYSWRLDYQLSEFEDLLKSGLSDAVPIRGVTVSKKDKAGVVHEVTIKTNSTRLALTGKKIYSLLKKVRSLCFTVVKRGKRVTFKGRGFGHHLGLCQWGARQMVHEGWGYKAILRFYYPGVKFMKVEVVQKGV